MDDKKRNEMMDDITFAIDNSHIEFKDQENLRRMIYILTQIILKGETVVTCT